MNWISVEDQLPCQGTEVLVWVIADDCEIAYYKNGKWISSMRGTLQEFNVSHWQPKPKSPNRIE